MTTLDDMYACAFWWRQKKFVRPVARGLSPRSRSYDDHENRVSTILKEDLLRVTDNEIMYTIFKFYWKYK